MLSKASPTLTQTGHGFNLASRRGHEMKMDWQSGRNIIYTRDETNNIFQTYPPIGYFASSSSDSCQRKSSFPGIVGNSLRWGHVWQQVIVPLTACEDPCRVRFMSWGRGDKAYWAISRKGAKRCPARLPFFAAAKQSSETFEDLAGQSLRVVEKESVLQSGHVSCAPANNCFLCPVFSCLAIY